MYINIDMTWRIEGDKKNSERHAKFRAIEDTQELGVVEAFIREDMPWEMTLFWIISYMELVGVGSNLLLEALNWGKKNGVTDLYADIIQTENLDQRIEWFKKRGFTIIDGYTAVGSVDHVISTLKSKKS